MDKHGHMDAKGMAKLRREKAKTLSLQYQASQHSKSLVLSQQSQTIDKENDGPNEAKSNVLSLIKHEQDIAFATYSKNNGGCVTPCIKFRVAIPN